MDDLVRQVLGRLGVASPAEAALIPMDGGITNRNFRLELRGETYVLRIGGENTNLLGIDRAREHAASAIAARLGVGAEVILADAGLDVMVTRHIPGPTLTPESASRPETVRGIVASIRRTHEGPDFPGWFSPFESAVELRRLALLHGVVPPAELAAAMVRLAEINRVLGRPDRPRPCHNDLLPGNFIDDGRSIRIIDWEYAAMGDPFFDLGNLAVNLSLDRDARRALLAEYFGEVRARDFARLELMRMASDMRESTWGFLQVGLSALEFDFMAYGRKHLDRFLLNAGGSDFPDLMRQAASAPGA